jgi:ATP-dependent DNA helicase PIF1
MPSDLIAIPESMHIPGGNLLSLLRVNYPNIADNVSNRDYFVNRAILTTKNDVTAINKLLLDCIPGRKITYSSVDQVCEQQHQLNVSTEFLNQVENGSLPPHQLDLKIGVPIMVLRNISASAGLCNGTRLIVRSLGTNIIEAIIATGPRAGDIAYTPKIKFT